MPNPLLQTIIQTTAPGKHSVAPNRQGMPEGETAFQEVLDELTDVTPVRPDADMSTEVETEGEVAPEVEGGDPETPSEPVAVNNAQPHAPAVPHQTTPDIAKTADATRGVARSPQPQAHTPEPDQVVGSEPDVTREPRRPVDTLPTPMAEKDTPARPMVALTRTGDQAVIQAKIAQLAKADRSSSEAEIPLAGARANASPNQVNVPDQNQAKLNIITSRPGGPARVERTTAPFESALSVASDVPDFAQIKDQPPTPLRDTSISQLPQPARAEIARAIAGQMAAAITPKPGGVEVALNPEELGRVSITFNGRDDGAHLTIVADRPETLDLMRRHISVLSQEFQKLGYGDLSLDLGTSDGTKQGPQKDTSTVTDGLTELQEDAGPAPQSRPVRPDGGLDMRL